MSLNLSIARRGAALALVAALFGPTAFAQVQRSGGGANVLLMQEYQQAVAERDQLKDDNAKLKKDLEDAKKQLQQLQAIRQQLAASKAGTSRVEAQLAAAQTSNVNGTKTIAEYKSRMDELIAKFRETVATLQGVETDRSQLRQQLAQSKAAYDQCAVANDALYRVTGEVLDRYQHQGAFSYLARAEPFTRLKRTEIDNLVVEYRERAEALRVKKPETPGTGTRSGASAGKSTPPGPASPPSSPVRN